MKLLSNKAEIHKCHELLGTKAEIHKCETVEEHNSNYAIWKMHLFNIYFNKFPSMPYCSHATYCNKHKNLLHK
uniref:Uncharacterized protein n=1 Tax=Setaria italica TaxID=4555 RepID=K3Y0L7_SETIT